MVGSGTTRRLAAVALAAVLSVAACSRGETGASPGADGGALYDANCASCHGGDLRGTDLGPSQLSIVYEPNHHDDDTYRRAIEFGAPQHHWGFGDMPAVRGLADDEVEAIIAFIRSVQSREGFEPYPPPP